jgi:hypothetical protein
MATSREYQNCNPRNNTNVASGHSTEFNCLNHGIAGKQEMFFSSKGKKIPTSGISEQEQNSTIFSRLPLL